MAFYQVLLFSIGFETFRYVTFAAGVFQVFFGYPKITKGWDLERGWTYKGYPLVNGVHRKDQPLHGKIGPLKIDR